MKTHPNEPSTGYGFCTTDGTSTQEWQGLTKREYFAAIAMQGLLGTLAPHSNRVFFERIANDAVEQADALIEALNKQS